MKITPKILTDLALFVSDHAMNNVDDTIYVSSDIFKQEDMEMMYQNNILQFSGFTFSPLDILPEASFYCQTICTGPVKFEDWDKLKLIYHDKEQAILDLSPFHLYHVTREGKDELLRVEKDQSVSFVKI